MFLTLLFLSPCPSALLLLFSLPTPNLYLQLIKTYTKVRMKKKRKETLSEKPVLSQEEGTTDGISDVQGLGARDF